MPHAKTEITEIVTGLATLGFGDLRGCLLDPPPAVRNVDDATWMSLLDAFDSGMHMTEFSRAWLNGRAFLAAADGLRGRVPLTVEWKGPHRQPGYDLVPADLRIDHVYLISCKYLSKILFNASPWFLFVRLLADRKGAGGDWYLEVAPKEYQALYASLRRMIPELPPHVEDLDTAERAAIRRLLQEGWPEDVSDLYLEMCREVAYESARRWSERLKETARREEMLWRLLRLAPAPYFVLGASPAGSLRLRILTPWDWRQEFSLAGFEVWPDAGAGQPVVRWRALVARRQHGDEVAVDGHVEIRWSHGRFGGHPEAKVYLDTPHEQVPGYAPLTPDHSVAVRQLGLALERDGHPDRKGATIVRVD
jgi:hypothetical protein